MKRKIVLFDIDGTLAPSRCKITHEIKSMLDELRFKGWEIGAVGGSDQEKHFEQLDGAYFDYNFCENGLVTFQNGGKFFKKTLMEEFLGKAFIETFVETCMQILQDFPVPFKTFNFVEVRTGMINICPIGRAVNQDQRRQFEEWDKDHNIREKIVQVLQPKFPQLHFAMGGKISIDAFPHGWDKTWCLQYLDAYDEIHFFGDMTHPGGNDHEIFSHARVKGHKVTDPQDTLNQIKKIFLF